MANRLLSDIIKARKQHVSLPKTIYDKHIPTFQGWYAKLKSKIATLQKK